MFRQILVLSTLFTIFTQMAAAKMIKGDSLSKFDGKNQIEYSDVGSVELFVAKKAALAGIDELIDSNTLIEYGVSNIDKGFLEKPTVIDGIQVTYCTSATALANPGLGTYADDLPAHLKNAHLVVSQGGKEIFNQLVGSLVIQGDATVNEGYAQVSPLLLGNTSKFTIEIKYPEGSAGAAANDYVRVKLRGMELK